jgi:hypothetical protein
VNNKKIISTENSKCLRPVLETPVGLGRSSPGHCEQKRSPKTCKIAGSPLGLDMQLYFVAIEKIEIARTNRHKAPKRFQLKYLFEV